MIRWSRRITGVITSVKPSTVGAPATVVIDGRSYFAMERWEPVARRWVGREVTALVAGMFVDETELTAREELNGLGSESECGEAGEGEL